VSLEDRLAEPLGSLRVIKATPQLLEVAVVYLLVDEVRERHVGVDPLDGVTDPRRDALLDVGVHRLPRLMTELTDRSLRLGSFPDAAVLGVADGVEHVLGVRRSRHRLRELDQRVAVVLGREELVERVGEVGLLLEGVLGEDRDDRPLDSVLASVATAVGHSRHASTSRRRRTL